ncbi:MAG TPA: SIMPL domain-containing protein, partial [Bacillota bacterium]|nr:SIMPL domain-containing protein [Bacillota bacterium]
YLSWQWRRISKADDEKLIITTFRKERFDLRKGLLLLLVFTLVSTAASAAGITVTGTAERMVQPDLALIELGVETQGDTAQQAVAENAALMTKVKKALLDYGISEEDLATSAFSLMPQYHYPRDSEPVLVGYKASNVLTITLRGKLDDVGKVLDLATSAGANKVQNVTFSVEKSQELQLELLAEAVTQGKEKAEAMAKAAGVKLGRLISMSDSTSSIIPYRINLREDVSVLKAASGYTTPIQPGLIRITAQVNLQFNIGSSKAPQRFPRRPWAGQYIGR